MYRATAALVPVAFVLATTAVTSVAQTTRDGVWPSSQIRLIVPAAPGGNPDVLARLLAQKLAAALGRPVVVENQGGAGGMVAAGIIARAPDVLRENGTAHYEQMIRDDKAMFTKLVREANIKAE